MMYSKSSASYLILLAIFMHNVLFYFIFRKSSKVTHYFSLFGQLLEEFDIDLLENGNGDSN